jgi:hypothetical protein
MSKEFKFGQIEKKDTMSVVSTMMETKMSQTSPIALEYLQFLSKKYGFCGEIIVTAFAHYCQAVLGLPCDNPDYRITNEGVNWFLDNGYVGFKKTIEYKPYPEWNWEENPCGNE